MIYVVLFGKR